MLTSRFATPAQVRASFIRWACILAPACLLLGMISGVVSNSGEANPWFAGLVKPALYPPPILFPIVWSILYLMMGVAFAFVVAARPSHVKGWAVFLFLKQFVLNLAWSPIFFGAHSLTWALVVIVAMDLTVIATMLVFAHINRAAALLLAPYLAWILFATGLNWQLLYDNPEADGVRGPVVALARA